MSAKRTEAFAERLAAYQCRGAPTRGPDPGTWFDFAAGLEAELKAATGPIPPLSGPGWDLLKERLREAADEEGVDLTRSPWLAMDGDGVWWAYSDRPHSNECWWADGGDNHCLCVLDEVGPDTLDWEESLIALA